MTHWQCWKFSLDKFLVKPHSSIVSAAMARVAQEYPSDLNELAGMRAFVRGACQSVWNAPQDEKSLDQIELALQEAACNIIRHAYKGATNQSIQVIVESDPERVQIRLHHNGIGFDPGSVKSPSFDGSRAGGWGVYLIERLVDEVHYSRDEQGLNTVQLIKGRS